MNVNIYENIDYKKTKIEVINKLEFDERKYIYLKHLSESKMSDEIIFSQCHMYDRGYKAMKKRAYIKMAYMLEIEIYKEGI